MRFGLSDYLAIGAALAVIAAAGVMWIREDGAESVRTQVTIDAAEQGQAIGAANTDAQQSVTLNTDALSAERNRLQQEVEDARQEIRHLTSLAPAQGRVGPGQMVDPAVGRSFVCRLQRMRRETPTACADRTGADAVPGSAHGRELPAAARPPS